MKKGLGVFAVVVALLVAFPVAATASGTPPVQASSVETIHFEDGSRLVIETVVFQTTTRSSSRSASQTGIGYDSSGNKTCSLTLKGTFSYDGNTSSATQSTYTYTIYKSGWKKDSASASRSGATAYAEGSFSNASDNLTISLSLTCDRNGNIS